MEVEVPPWRLSGAPPEVLLRGTSDLHGVPRVRIASARATLGYLHGVPPEVLHGGAEVLHGGGFCPSPDPSRLRFVPPVALALTLATSMEYLRLPWFRP